MKLSLIKASKFILEDKDFIAFFVDKIFEFDLLIKRIKTQLI